MKKLLIFVTIIIIFLCMLKSETIIIPKEAIRFRVIANSNEEQDQQVKKKVVENLNSNIKDLKLIPKDISTSRNLIKESIPSFKESIDKTLEELNVKEEYTVEYGMNYFPEKEYKGITYQEGEYESLVIKLGDGAGDNFWCVLFPPLCLLEGEETEGNKTEYTSFIKELIDKYF